MLLARVPARCSKEEVTLPARAAARFGFLFLPSLEVTGTSGRAASDSDLKSSLYSSLFSVLSGKFIRTLNKAWIGFLESIDTIQFLKTNMFSKHRERINNDHSTVKFSLSTPMNEIFKNRTSLNKMSLALSWVTFISLSDTFLSLKPFFLIKFKWFEFVNYEKLFFQTSTNWEGTLDLQGVQMSE